MFFPQRRLTFNGLHGVIYQNTEFFKIYSVLHNLKVICLFTEIRRWVFFFLRHTLSIQDMFFLRLGFPVGIFFELN
jgi:hypothetical protein